MSSFREDLPSRMVEHEAPVVEELIPVPDTVAVFQQFCHWPGCLFLDSALQHPTLGRYSFASADPCAIISSASGSVSRAMLALETCLEQGRVTTLHGLPPFQGGVAGILSYELGRTWEASVSAPRFDDLRVPELVLGVYDVVVAWDHEQNRAWLISHGYPETDVERRGRRASARMTQFRRRLAGLDTPSVKVAPPSVPAASLQAPALAVRGRHDVLSNFTEREYLALVQRAIDYIHAGDVFQVNIAQRLLCPAVDEPYQLYLRLRGHNPATFAGYFDAGTAQIVSASPERFLRIEARNVETRPIKGTRARTRHQPEADLFAGSDLQESEKDRAENIMIVDLLRNDLSRICEPSSVRVPQLCRLEPYAFVQHLVSVVTGRLRDEIGVRDILGATFPGGSITGAPKVRAMQIIAELERTVRGSYCGCLGYFGWDGTCDLNLLIRTITATRGWWHLPVGGGIVADSQPVREYAETWDKAEGMLRALRD